VLAAATITSGSIGHHRSRDGTPLHTYLVFYFILTVNLRCTVPNSQKLSRKHEVASEEDIVKYSNSIGKWRKVSRLVVQGELLWWVAIFCAVSCFGSSASNGPSAHKWLYTLVIKFTHWCGCLTNYMVHLIITKYSFRGCTTTLVNLGDVPCTRLKAHTEIISMCVMTMTSDHPVPYCPITSTRLPFCL